MIFKMILEFCDGNKFSSKDNQRVFHIGYISGNRNKTTGKFDYYNLPGIKIRYEIFTNFRVDSNLNTSLTF